MWASLRRRALSTSGAAGSHETLRVHPAGGSSSSCWFSPKQFYLRPSILSGKKVLLGLDYLQFTHIRGIRVRAQRAAGRLPHAAGFWNPPDSAGNAVYRQYSRSFPWIPTRTGVVPLFNPDYAFAVGVALAAASRRLSSRTFSAGERACARCGGSVPPPAGRFACAGYFTSRVAGGHLVLLEAYCRAAHLLLVADRTRSLAGPGEPPETWDLGALAAVARLSSPHWRGIRRFRLTLRWERRCCILLLRTRGRLRAHGHGHRDRSHGVGATMGRVVADASSLIGRSTRLLALSASRQTDIYMPYGRLLAFFTALRQGQVLPAGFGSLRPAAIPSAIPTQLYLRDTASYVGLLPLLARPCRVIGLVHCKPIAPAHLAVDFSGRGGRGGAHSSHCPCPNRYAGASRWHAFCAPRRACFYITTFSLAAIFGAGVDAFLNSNFLKKLRPRQVRGVERFVPGNSLPGPHCLLPAVRRTHPASAAGHS